MAGIAGPGGDVGVFVGVFDKIVFPDLKHRNLE